LCDNGNNMYSNASTAIQTTTSMLEMM